jgi:hypothetical protein
MKKIPLTFLSLILLILPLSADNILGEMAGIIQLESDEDTSEVVLTLEDLAVVSFLYDNPFVQGVELIFNLSTEARNFPNSFALYLYRSIVPEPVSAQTSYRGNQFFMQILPFSSEFSVKIPFEPSNSLKKDAASVVTSPVSIDNFPLMITLLPIMKGLPMEAKSAKISMIARPIYENRGGLKIDLVKEDELIDEDILVTIDEKAVPWPYEYYSLEPGFHSVVISHMLSGKKEFNIAIEKGKFTSLRYTLEAELPRVYFEQDKGLSYLLDGEELSEKDMESFITLTPGVHLIEIRLNDTLTIKREFDFHAGENVTISLDAQILVEKD